MPAFRGSGASESRSHAREGISTMDTERLINADPNAEWAIFSREQLRNLRETIQFDLSRLGPSDATEYVRLSQYRDEMRLAYRVGDDISERICIDIVRGKAPVCRLSVVLAVAIQLGIKAPKILIYPPEEVEA